MATAKVSEKSTKTEIWNAYNQLLEDLQSKSISVSEDPAKLQKMTAAMSEAKAALMGHFEATIERLGTIQEAYHEADEDLAHRKDTVIDALEQSKRDLQTSIEIIKKQWETEKADRESQRQREEETYAYNLTRKRRDDEEAYAQKTKEREAKFAARETALDEREESVKALAEQVDAFPAKLDNATKTTRDETTKELKAQASNELKDARQQLEHEKSILVLKLQGAEASIGAQAKQITELQRQLDSSSTQLKEMAVASHPVKKRFYDPNPSGLNSQNLPMNMDLRIVG
jgi:DNA repair exonuclease SbcCD ATPase subunit